MEVYLITYIPQFLTFLSSLFSFGDWIAKSRKKRQDETQPDVTPEFLSEIDPRVLYFAGGIVVGCIAMAILIKKMNGAPITIINNIQITA